jgi:hypothetical protein
MVSIKQPLISLILANLAMTSPLAHTVPRADNTTLPIKVPAVSLNSHNKTSKAKLTP